MVSDGPTNDAPRPDSQVTKPDAGPVSADDVPVSDRARSLAPMLADGDPRVRKSAVVALGRLACSEAAEELCGMLDDPDDGVRVLACQALGRLADPGSVPALLVHVHDPSAEVRAGLLWALANVAAHAGLSDEGRAALFTPVAVLAFDPDDGVRADAAAVMGTLRDTRATDALVVLLEDDCPRVRANACASLALTDDAPGLAALLDVLEGEERDALVLVSALDGVARRAERGSLAEGSDEAVRAVSAACRLSEAGDGSVCPTNPSVEALGADDAGAAGPADVRATAVWALGLVAPYAPGARGAVLDALSQALRCGEPWRVRYAAESLARLHGDDACDLLRLAAPAWLDEAGSPRPDVDAQTATVVVQALATFR